MPDPTPEPADVDFSDEDLGLELPEAVAAEPDHEPDYEDLDGHADDDITFVDDVGQPIDRAAVTERGTD